MKRIAKLSLVAAVAVAGLTNVNAASLEEAIQGVDVSGQFRFRANDQSDKTNSAGFVSSGENGTDVEIEVGVKVPVTDEVTAVFKIDNANDDTDSVTKGEVDIEDYYFSYNAGDLTVNAGQQNIPGRMTDGAQGDGLVVLNKVGGFTIGAAAFITNSATADENVYSVIGMGKVGPLAVLAQYADVENTAGAYNLKADAKLGMANVGVEYVALDLDANNNKMSTLKVAASTKIDKISAKIAYAATGKDGSGSIDQGAETASEYLLWNTGTAGMADLSAFVVDASFAVSPKTSVRLAYLGGDYAGNNDVSEVLGQVSYKVAKNLSTYVRFASVEKGATEFTRGRVEAKYSF